MRRPTSPRTGNRPSSNDVRPRYFSGIEGPRSSWTRSGNWKTHCRYKRRSDRSSGRQNRQTTSGSGQNHGGIGNGAGTSTGSHTSVTRADVIKTNDYGEANENRANRRGIGGDRSIGQRRGSFGCCSVVNRGTSTTSSGGSTVRSSGSRTYRRRHSSFDGADDGTNRKGSATESPTGAERNAWSSGCSSGRSRETRHESGRRPIPSASRSSSTRSQSSTDGDSGGGWSCLRHRPTATKGCGITGTRNGTGGGGVGRSLRSSR